MEKIMAAMAMVAAVLLAAGGGGEAAVYKVGDSAGWTIMNSPNYTAWASSKSFHVGDTVVFEYNKQFHNVIEVNESDYKSCSAASPIATYTTGNDSLVLKREGHYYFLCGFPGHCAAGQKVDVDVAASSSAAPSEAPSPSSAAPAPASDVAGSTNATAGGTPASPPPQGNGAAAGAVPNALAFAAAVMSLAAGGFLMRDL